MAFPMLVSTLHYIYFRSPSTMTVAFMEEGYHSHDQKLVLYSYTLHLN